MGKAAQGEWAGRPAVRPAPHEIGKENRVGVFLAHTSAQDAHDFEAAWGVLDGEERARARSFAFASDRRTYVLAHGLLRSVLATAAGAPAAGLRFTRTVTGRPELVPLGPGHPLPRFSLSHTRGLFGCAVTAAADIGLDLEEVRLPAPLGVATRFFSRDEVDLLRALPHRAQHEQFFVLWTLKESVLKALGTGLSRPLDSFVTRGECNGAASLRLPETPGGVDPDWTLRWWDLGRYRAALAVRIAERAAGIELRTGLRLSELATEKATR